MESNKPNCRICGGADVHLDSCTWEDWEENNMENKKYIEYKGKYDTEWKKQMCYLLQDEIRQKMNSAITTFQYVDYKVREEMVELGLKMLIHGGVEALAERMNMSVEEYIKVQSKVG